MNKKKNESPTNPLGQKYEITELGSLGILAMGYRGFRQWRVVRDNAIQKNKDHRKKNK